MARKKPAPRPRRTRTHIIADQSVNFVERFFIDRGHTVDRPGSDYGTDLLVNTFDEEGYAEGGDIRLQLKATDQIQYSADGESIVLRVETKHYRYWMDQVMPVFLILYDAGNVKAYWLYLQAYFQSTHVRKPRKDSTTFTIRIPTENQFSSSTVDYMRERKAAVLETGVGHEQS